MKKTSEKSPKKAKKKTKKTKKTKKKQRTKCEVVFRQVYITPPTIQEGGTDKEIQEDALLPNNCRVRHLTYAADVEVDVELRTYEINDQTLEELQTDSREGMVAMGKIPVMVRSMLCTLTQQIDSSKGQRVNITEYNECPYDQVIYISLQICPFLCICVSMYLCVGVCVLCMVHCALCIVCSFSVQCLVLVFGLVILNCFQSYVLSIKKGSFFLSYFSIIFE